MVKHHPCNVDLTVRFCSEALIFFKNPQLISKELSSISINFRDDKVDFFMVELVDTLQQRL